MKTVTARAATQSGFCRKRAAQTADQSWIGGKGGGFFAGAAAVGGEGGAGGAAAGAGVTGRTGGAAGVSEAAPGAGADLIAGVSTGFSARGGFASWVADSEGRDRGNGGPLGAAG